MKKAFFIAVGVLFIFGTHTNTFAQSKVRMNPEAQVGYNLNGFKGKVEFVSRRHHGGHRHSFRGHRHGGNRHFYSGHRYGYSQDHRHGLYRGYGFKGHFGGLRFKNFFRPYYSPYGSYYRGYYPGSRYYRGYGYSEYKGGRHR